MNKIVIYTDGSSKGNPGPGGWGAIITYNNRVVELGGGETHTTNNRMELTAAIEALSFLDSKGYKLQITRRNLSGSNFLFALLVSNYQRHKRLFGIPDNENNRIRKICATCCVTYCVYARINSSCTFWYYRKFADLLFPSYFVFLYQNSSK